MSCIIDVMDKEIDFFNTPVYHRITNSIFNNAMISNAKMCDVSFSVT